MVPARLAYSLPVPRPLPHAPSHLVDISVMAPSLYRFGQCEVRIASREVMLASTVRPLQPRPFDLLVYLIENRHRVVTLDELLDKVWPDGEVQPGCVAAAVMRARKAIGDDGKSQAIRTYFRVGYRFVAALV